MFRLFAVCILVATLNAVADGNPAATRQAISTTALPSLVSQLQTLLKPKIKSLDRDMITFHYESSTSLNPNSISDVSRWMLGKPGRYFKTSIVDTNMQGPGLYLAVDSLASRGFGGTEPELSVIKLKSGAEVLDLTASDSRDDSAFNAITAQFSCASSGPLPDNLSDGLGALRQSQDSQCRSLVVNALKNLAVQGIMYDYSASNLTNCRPRSVAINVIDASAVEVDSYFSDSKKFDSSSVEGFISSLQTDASQDFSVKIGLGVGSSTNLPAAISQTAKPQDYERWKAQYLFACGANWVFETNQNASQLMISLRQLVTQNTDLQNLIIKAKTAFEAKAAMNVVSGLFFDMGRIKKVEVAIYQGLNWAPDMSKFDQFIKARDLPYSPSIDLAKQQELLLEESTTLTGSPTNILGYINQLPPMTTPPTDPVGLIKSIYSKFGYGPRYMSLNISPIMMWMGGPPIDVDLATYTQIFRDCGTMYADPNQTIEDIQASDCAIRVYGN